MTMVHLPWKRMGKMDSPEQLWDQLLSRQPDQIVAAYLRLAVAEQAYVVRHLERMAAEPGWYPEQRLSAQAALAAIKDSGRAGGE
jgi:hypothetical protein